MKRSTGTNFIPYGQAFIILASFFLLPSPIDAQVLVQDSKGDSSILYQGCTIGFDFSETALEFDYNNFANRRFEDFEKHVVWGIQLRAKNKVGVANLLDSGKWTPETKGVITFGYSFSNLNSKEYMELSQSINKLDAEIDKLDNHINNIVNDAIAKFFESIIDKKDSDKLKEELDPMVSKTDFNNLETSIRNVAAKNPAYKKCIMGLADNLHRDLKKDLESKRKITLDNEARIEQQQDYRESHRYIRTSFYMNIGVTANAFTYFNESNAENYGKRFEDKIFKGAIVNIGANLQWGGRYLFGINAGVQRINNLDFLAKKEFTLRNTETLNSQELISEKKITAYAGTYGTLNRYNINADVLRFQKLENHVIVGHAYLRHGVSSDRMLVPTQTDMGLGLYFFKNDGAFLGGLYVEAPDIANNIEKLKAQPDIKPFHNRLRFGVVAKIALGSLSII